MNTTFAHRAWLTGVAAAAALTGLMPTVAAAQSAADTVQTGQATQVEEVIVTGRKRSERLLDVPSAATTFDAERLEREHIDGLLDLLRKTPGAVTAYLGTTFSSEVIIRGQGTGRVINSEIATGLYRNGALTTGGNIGGRNFNRLDLFDAQQIEVFRGPQSGLFGRDAVGGAISVVSQRPTDDFGGKVTARYGRNERYEVEGVVNLPVSDAVGLRVAGIYIDQNKGFFTNTTGPRYQDREDFQGVRGTLSYRPGTHFEAFLTADYFDERGPSFAVGNYNPAVAGSPYVASDNVDSRFYQRQYSAILETNTDLPIGRLSTNTAYIKRDGTTVDDVDGFLNIAVPAFANYTRDATDDFYRFGQEVYLASSNTDRLRWLIGGEYLHLQDDYYEQSLGLAAPLAASNNTIAANSVDNSYAVYGTLDYDLTDRLILGSELRYSVDDKSADLDSQIFSSTNVPTRIVGNFSETFDNLSPTVSLKYKITPFTTAFARIASAYRAGGFNPIPDAVTPSRFSISYDSETTVAYELGIKSELFDRRLRLDLTAYQTNTDGILVTDRVAVGQTFVNFVRNGGEAEQFGVELDGSLFVPLGEDGASITFDAAASYATAHYTSGVFKDVDVPYVRPWQVSLSSTLRLPVNDHMTAFANHSFVGAYKGWQDQPSNRRLDDIPLHNFALGVETERLRIALNVQNATDEFFNPQRTSATAVRASIPRTWLVSVTGKF